MISSQNIQKEMKKREFSKEIRTELLEILKERKSELEKLKNDFNFKRNLKYFKKLKRRFPLFNDYQLTLIKFEDYPKLELLILITWLLERKMPDFYQELLVKINHLKKYLQSNKKESREGREIYEFLIGKGERGINLKEFDKELNALLKNLEIELTGYECEKGPEVYREREIKKLGLVTADAVKCLKDFKGRTFPFLRTIATQIKKDYQVLEVGAGTGILGIAAVLSGAKKVVGAELNPITSILAKIIVEYLENQKVIPINSVEIICGDALKFGKEEYKKFRGKRFDALISENIYTGMFFELQMRMISHVLENNLLNTYQGPSIGIIWTKKTNAPVIPEGLSSGMELVELGRGQKFKTTNEVMLELKRKGIKVTTLSKDRIYDQIDFTAVDIPNIISRAEFKVLRNGFLNGITFYSTVRMMKGDYIDRNENKFMNNDSALILNKSIPVKKGDLVLVSLAYTEADNVDDIVLEVRKFNKDGSLNKKYDARLNIPERRHKENLKNFIDKHKLKEELDLKSSGDFEMIRSSSIKDGYERIWLMDIDYKNLKGYSV